MAIKDFKDPLRWLYVVQDTTVSHAADLMREQGSHQLACYRK